MRKPWRVIFVSLAAIALMTVAAVSDQIDWPINGVYLADLGVVISGDGDDDDDSGEYRLIPDGQGGAILVYVNDTDETDSTQIYAQRIDAGGNVLWETGGAPACTTGDNHATPRGVPDGTGGAILAWNEESWPVHSSYVQRLDSSGTPQWGIHGVALSDTVGYQAVEIVTDGAGGAIVAWADVPVESWLEQTLRVQRVSSSGSLLWAPGGLEIDQSSVLKDYAIAPNGSGGVFVVWTEYDDDLVLANLDSSGGYLWHELLTWTWDEKRDLCICEDGLGGAIVAWAENRNFQFEDIYAQRVNSSGDLMWGSVGVTVCAAGANQDEPRLVSDGAGGAIFAWFDERNYGDVDVYAQRVDVSGALQWPTDGVGVCSAGGVQDMGFAGIVSDGFGGAIVTWMDYRTGSDYDIYAQRLDSSGQFLYYAEGLEICTDGAFQVYPVVVSDGSGGAIIAWADIRAGAPGYYAQRLANTGILDGGWSDLGQGNELLQNVPNPFSTGTKIAFQTKKYGDVRLQVFDAAGRLVRTLLDGSAKPPVQIEEWDGKDVNGRRVPAGTYFYRIEGDGWSDTKKMMVVR